MFVRTDRLFLRPAWLEDVPELTRAFAQEQVARMLANAPWPYREEHARASITEARDARLPRLLVTLPAERGRIVGGCGLGEADGEIEVGYWIAPGHWGRGFTTEALRGVMSLAATLGHRRIGARHAADNPASGRVLRKVGFRETGRTRPFHSLGRGTWVEGLEYALDLCGEADDPGDVPMKHAARPPSRLREGPGVGLCRAYLNWPTPNPSRKREGD